MYEFVPERKKGILNEFVDDFKAALIAELGGTNQRFCQGQCTNDSGWQQSRPQRAESCEASGRSTVGRCENSLSLSFPIKASTLMFKKNFFLFFFQLLLLRIIEMLLKYLQFYSIPYIETSAKTGQNIQEAFLLTAK